MIPKIIATAIDVIKILPPNNDKVKPPIPTTKITEHTKIFFVLLKSIFSLINNLTPLDAINPYRINETPPVTQPGIVDNKAVNGVINPITIVIIAASKTTLTLAIFVIPITATFSPYVVFAAPHSAPDKAVATPSPIKVRVIPGSPFNKSLLIILPKFS